MLSKNSKCQKPPTKSKMNQQPQWELVNGQFTGTRFIWTIDNYSRHYLVTGKKISSSIFFSGKGYRDQWRLDMYPRGEYESTKENITLYLKLIQTSKHAIKANVKFEILKPGSDHEPVHGSVCTISDGKWIQGSREGIAYFADSNKFETYVKNDSVQISCVIEFISDTKDEWECLTMKTRRLSAEFGTVEHSLTNDLWRSFNDSKFTDVIITVEDKQFHVHKFILKIRSPILAAKLATKPNDSGYDEILIDKMKPEVVQKMLHFMYTDKIDNFEEMIEDLLVAADKYSLDSLKALCVKSLCDRVTVDNVANNLQLGEQHHSNILKNYCAKFILSHLREVLRTPGYADIEDNYPELACFLIRTWATEMIQLN